MAKLKSKKQRNQSLVGLTPEQKQKLKKLFTDKDLFKSVKFQICRANMKTLFQDELRRIQVRLSPKT
jgi:hypothetical protein